MYKALISAFAVSTCLGSIALADGKTMKFTAEIPPLPGATNLATQISKKDMI